MEEHERHASSSRDARAADSKGNTVVCHYLHSYKHLMKRSSSAHVIVDAACACGCLMQTPVREREVMQE